MEFRKMLMITLYAEQKKRHRFIEHTNFIQSSLHLVILYQYFAPSPNPSHPGNY